MTVEIRTGANIDTGFSQRIFIPDTITNTKPPALPEIRPMTNQNWELETYDFGQSKIEP